MSKIETNLRYRITESENVIAYLVASDAPDDGGTTIRSESEFDALLKNPDMNGSGKFEIIISSSMETARAMALLRAGKFDEAVITRINDNTYATGVTRFENSMMQSKNEAISRFPLITDLREEGSMLEFEGSFPDLTDINVEIEKRIDGLELIDLDVQPKRILTIPSPEQDDEQDVSFPDNTSWLDL